MRREARRCRLEIVVVNNGCEGPEIAEAARLDSVRVESPGKNLGFAGGCNLGAAYVQGEILLFLNPDTVVAPGAIEKLARTLDDASIGVATPRLRLLQEPDRLNSSGNVLHISGLAWVGGYREPVAEATGLHDVPFPTGAAMAIRAELFRELGGFRAELFLYHEDVDMGWRVRQSGRRVVVDAAADVYHDYCDEMTPAKRYFLERNRLAVLAFNCSPRLLVVLTPIICCAELAVGLVAWREAWLREKARGWAWCLRNANTLARLRRETQRLRRVPDSDLVDLLTVSLDDRVVTSPRAVAFANRLLTAYWPLARRAL